MSLLLYDLPMRILTNKDIFLEEYSPKETKEIFYKTGFDGSSAYALDLGDKILLFVDGRYYIQAQEQVKSHVQVKLSLKGALNGLCEYLKNNPIEDLLIDFRRVTLEEAENLKQYATLKHDTLKEVQDYIALKQKIVLVEEPKKFLKGQHYISHGAMISWVLGARAFLPETYKSHPQGKLLIQQGEMLFFTPHVEGWESIVKSYSLESWIDYINSKEYLFDDRFISYYDYLKIPLKKESYMIQKEQNKKNSLEVQALKKVASTHVEILKKTKIFFQDSFSEKEFVEKFKSFFEEYQVEDFSFSPICSMNEKTRIIHYKDQNEKKIEPKVFLVDMGIYLKEGYASDMTRTFFKQPTQEQKEKYTLVLKALIRVESKKMKTPPKGYELDLLAKSIIDFPHGLGHGIGIEVHEPGILLSLKGIEPMEESYVMSIEPGFYCENYGIRLENMVLLKKNEKEYYFEPLTYYPYEEEMIIKEMLSEEEKKYLQNYQSKC